MEQAVGNSGIYELTVKVQDRGATAKTFIGYFDGSETHFFKGELRGQIARPYGNEGFGWDSIFQPYGISETFAEMGPELKNQFSMRREAFLHLKKHLDAAR